MKKLAVLLLFSNCSASFSLLLAIPRYQKLRKTRCFAAIFKLFALLFSNCDEFQIFFSEKKSKFSEKFVNPEFFCCQPFKNGWRLTVLLLFSIFSVSFSFSSQVPKSGRKLAVLLFALLKFHFFQFFLKKKKKLKKLKFSEKIVTPEIFCCNPFKNGWKLVVLLLFSKCSASFSLLFGSSQVSKVAEN